MENVVAFAVEPTQETGGSLSLTLRGADGRLHDLALDVSVGSQKRSLRGLTLSLPAAPAPAEVSFTRQPNGYVVTTIRAICRETYQGAYPALAALTVVVPALGTALAVLLFSL